jgi:hypothetical protein
MAADTTDQRLTWAHCLNKGASMNNESVNQQAMMAAAALLGRVLLIRTEADLTPAGKRTARIVQHAKNGRRTPPHIRWYVGGKAYRSLSLTEKNIAVTGDWSPSFPVLQFLTQNELF